MVLFHAENKSKKLLIILLKYPNGASQKFICLIVFTAERENGVYAEFLFILSIIKGVIFFFRPR